MKQVIERDAFPEFQPAVEKWPLGGNWWIRSAYNAHTLHTQYTHQQHHHHCLILSFSPGLNEHTHTQTVWAYLNKMPRKLGNSEISSGNPGLIKMDVFFFPPWLLWYHARPRSSAIEGGAAMWGCAWFLKWAGRWTGGGEHCKRFCYWGKLHHHDLNCESSSIAHNELLFWAGDGSLQLHACWICGLN